MSAERITPEAVAAERDVLDGDERLILGDVVVTIGFTNAAVKTLAPREMEELAGYLFALIDRAPLKTGRAHQPHRMVLGALASELRGFAAAAGIPIGPDIDLRASASQQAERELRARMADREAAMDRHIDDVIASHHGAASRPAPATSEGDTATTEPAAAPVIETDDDAWA